MAAPVSVKNLVFDLDKVLVFSQDRLSEIKESERNLHRFIAIPGLSYFTVPGVLELLSSLAKEPDVRISFFSSGTERRNLTVVEWLADSSLLKTQKEITVLSKHHLSKGSPAKKDLKKILRPGDSLSEAILIDDSVRKAHHRQLKNLLFVPKLSFAPEKNQLWRQANRIYYVAGLLFTALTKSREEGLPLKEALFMLQHPPETVFEFPEENRDLYYEIGLKKLQEMNPRLKFFEPQNRVKIPHLNLRSV